MASPCTQEVNQPHITNIIYEDVMLIEVPVGGADVSGTHKRSICCSRQRVCEGSFALQGFKVEFLLILNRFKQIRGALLELLRCQIEQLQVVFGQVVGP